MFKFNEYIGEGMPGLDNLNMRLNYRGGNQEGRMIQGKADSLRKALLYSYQAATAKLADGREFRCLINSDKLKMDYDDKIISIPFEDICLNSEKKEETTTLGREVIDMKPGDVFEWKETGTHWLVYLRRLEEDAYFRAEIRRCLYELKINDTDYKVYARNANKETITWHTRRTVGSWNDLDYKLVLYITKNDETIDYFSRFKVINFNGENWEVQTVDNVSTEGVIELYLKEHFTNSIEKESEEKREEIQAEKEEVSYLIQGETIVYPYDEKQYSLVGADEMGGTWLISNKKAVILPEKETDTITVAITSGKSGNFEIIYRRDGEEDIVLPVQIKSL